MWWSKRCAWLSSVLMCFCKGRNLDGNLAGRVSITELLQVETVVLTAAAVRSVRAAWHMFLPWAWLVAAGCWHGLMSMWGVNRCGV